MRWLRTSTWCLAEELRAAYGLANMDDAGARCRAIMGIREPALAAPGDTGGFICDAEIRTEEVLTR
jgi:hypothetical protein